MMKIKNKYNQQRGSVFFYILLGIVLFGTLAFTISRGMRGKQVDTMSDRQAEIAASEIIDYARKIQHNIDSLRRSGISESNIDFSSNIFSRHLAAPPVPWDSNPNCTDSSCKIFSSVGSSLTDVTFENYSKTLTIPFSTSHPKEGHPTFYRISVIGAGTPAEDLVLEIINIKDKVCDAINNYLDLPNASSMAQEEWGSAGQTAYAGDGYWNFSNVQSAEPLLDEATEIQGKSEGCYNQSNYGNTYFKILIER